MKIILMMI